MNKKWILFFVAVGAAVIALICFLFLGNREPDVDKFRVQMKTTAETKASSTKAPATQAPVTNAPATQTPVKNESAQDTDDPFAVELNAVHPDTTETGADDSYEVALYTEPPEKKATQSGGAGQAKATAEPPTIIENSATDPDDEGEETFGKEAIFQTGKAGVNFATGEGPGSAGYQEADGYGIETVIVYTAEEIAAAPAASAPVSPAEPVASLAGITVDFGAASLASENATLTVRTLPDRTDEANGFGVSAWDLELSGQDAFDGPVAVTLPYGDLGGQNPAAVIMPQHYNEELGRWEYVSYDIHPEAGTVTVYLRHFSPVSVIRWLLGLDEEKEKLDSAQSRMLKLAVMPEQIKEEIEQNPEIQKQLAEFGTIISRAKADQKTLYENGGILELLYKNLGNCFDSAALSTSMLEYVKYIKPKTAGVFSAISLAYLTYDTGKKATDQYMNGKTGDSILTLLKASPDFIVGLLSVKAASDAIAGVSTLAIAQPEILMAVGAVFLVKNLMDANYPAEAEPEKTMSPMDKTYINAPYGNLYWDRRSHEMIAIPPDINETFNDTAIRQMQNSGIKPTDNPDSDVMIQVFFGDELCRTYYTKEFLEVYEGFKARRAAFREAGTNELGTYLTDSYSIVRLGPLYEDVNDWWNPGWRDILKYIQETHREDPENWFPTMMTYLEKADEAAYEYAYDKGIFTGYSITDNQLSSTDVIGTILDRMKKRNMFKSFNQNCLAVSDEKNIASLQAMKKNQNRVVRFRLQDKEGKAMTFNETEYAGKFIIMDTHPKEYTLTEPWVVEMNQPDYLTCTYNGYAMAGSPKKLLVYDSREAYQNGGEPLKEIPLEKEVGEKSITHTLKLPRARQEGTVYRFKEMANMAFGIHGDILVKLMWSAAENMTITLREDGTFSAHGSSETEEKPEPKWVSTGLLNSKAGYWASSSHAYQLSFDLSGQIEKDGKPGSCTIKGKMEGWYEYTRGDSVHRETRESTFEGIGSEARLEHSEEGDLLIVGFLHHEDDGHCELNVKDTTKYADSDQIKTEDSDWILRFMMVKEP